MVRSKVAVVGRHRAEKLTRSLLMESVNVDNAFLQQLGFEALIRLRQGLKRAIRQYACLAW